jgi:uncharacterized CHY-type Zn-finger protein
MKNLTYRDIWGTSKTDGIGGTSFICFNCMSGYECLPFPDDEIKKPREILCGDCRAELKESKREFRNVTRIFFKYKRDKLKRRVN